MDETLRAIYVEITDTRGSAPRDAGTVMTVTSTGSIGTVGGGALEYRAIRTAREILATGGASRSETIPLGPGLGQCCGGAVTLLYTFTQRHAEPAHSPEPLEIPDHITQPQPLWLWGAGHVGRAVVTAAPREAFDVTWIDTAPDRFPDHTPTHVTAITAADMPVLAARAPHDAHHLIFTYAHEIDLALCAALLKRGAASIGLIGSATKWTRFSRRLRALGLDPSPITCPIGDKSLGKRPEQIAQGTLRGLLCTTRSKALQ